MQKRRKTRKRNFMVEPVFVKSDVKQSIINQFRQNKDPSLSVYDHEVENLISEIVTGPKKPTRV